MNKNNNYHAFYLIEGDNYKYIILSKATYWEISSEDNHFDKDYWVFESKNNSEYKCKLEMNLWELVNESDNYWYFKYYNTNKEIDITKFEEDESSFGEYFYVDDNYNGIVFSKNNYEIKKLKIYDKRKDEEIYIIENENEIVENNSKLIKVWCRKNMKDFKIIYATTEYELYSDEFTGYYQYGDESGEFWEVSKITYQEIDGDGFNYLFKDKDGKILKINNDKWFRYQAEFDKWIFKRYPRGC